MGERGEVVGGRARRKGLARRLETGALFALALGGLGHAQDMLTDANAFTAAVARLYREGSPGVETQIAGPLELTVKSARGDEKIYLNTIFSACLRNRDACATFVARQVDAMKGGLGPRAAPDLADIRITVRPSAYVDDLLAAARPGADVLAEPLADDLWMLGVSDQPTTIATLSQSDLDALKLSPDQAIALGKRNLEGAARRLIGEAVARGANGVARFHGSDYTASLIAFPDLWEPLAEKFDGRLLVAVPASDVMLIADGRRPAIQAQMLTAVAQTMARAQRPISSALFEWTPTGWNKIAEAEVKPR